MVFIKTDLTKDEDIENAIQQAAGLGTIKYLANIAGIQHIDSVDNFPMEKYDFMQRLMLRAPFYLAKLAIPHMKKSKDGVGIIGHLASTHAHICTKNKPVYNNEIRIKSFEPIYCGRRRGKDSFFYPEHRFCKNPAGIEPDPSPGRAARQPWTRNQKRQRSKCQ